MMRRPLDAKNVLDNRDYPYQFSFPILSIDQGCLGS